VPLLRCAGELAQCERLLTRHDRLRMFADEFEMVVKTLARLKPETYLEIGSGAPPRNCNPS
jgi:hypothetical protein